MRFQFTLGLATGRTPPGFSRETISSAAQLYTTGLSRDALLTLLWWWEGMLNSSGREDEAKTVRKTRLRFLGRKRAAPSSAATSPVARKAKHAKRASVRARSRRPRQD